MSVISKSKHEVLERFPEYAGRELMHFVEQDYVRKRASAHAIMEGGQQHIAIEEMNRIAIILSYPGRNHAKLRSS